MFALKVLLGIECGVAAALFLPILTPQKQALGNWLDKSSIGYPLKIAVLAFTAIAGLTSASAWMTWSKLASPAATAAGNVNHHMLAEAERDFFLSSFALVLLVAIARYFALLSEHHSLGVNMSAMKRQAESSSKAVTFYMDSNKELEKEVAALKKGGGGGSGSGKKAKEGDKDDEKEKETGKEEGSSGGDKAAIKKLEAELQAMVRQAESQRAAYDKLSAENERLRTQLQDYDIVLGGAKKKAS